jgi:cytoskeletal protein CcmA (bactofilin family)
MALFVKEDKTQRLDEHPKVSPVQVSHHEEPSTTREMQANLGKGSRVEGKLSFEGSVRIDGQVEGDINAQDTVVIGKNAEVTAQIHASTVVVEGRVNGDITARQRVELRAPARLFGNLVTPSLVIHEGAVFEGHCQMGGAEARAERGEKRIALFPTEERAAAARRSSEAAS